jgi:hypothetical protein
MALDINGALIESSNAAIKITANGVTGLDINASNFPVKSTRPYFAAMGSSAAWTNYASAAWNTMIFNSAMVNNGGHYNTSNGRFTAPVSGTYYFNATTYSYKNPDTSTTSYLHPVFTINGSFTYRQSSQTTAYRLRLRTNLAGAYTGDTQINDIFYLGASEYVNYTIYSSGALQWYPPYSLFSGYLIG